MTYKLSGDELLTGAFYFKKVKKFKMNCEYEFIKIMNEISKEPNMEELFEECVFDEDDINPKCMELKEGLQVLIQSRGLIQKAPDMNVYEIGESIEHRYEKYIKGKLTGSQQKAINELSEKMDIHFNDK